MKVRMYENYGDKYAECRVFTSALQVDCSRRYNRLIKLGEEELKEMFNAARIGHKIRIVAYAFTDDGEAIACKDSNGDEWFIASDDDVGEDAIFGGYGDDECLYVGTYHGKSYYLFWSDYHTLRQYFDLSIFKRLIPVDEQ